MKINEGIVDELESSIEQLQEDDEVAYAEVGAIFRDKSIISTREKEINTSSDISDSGVWCRVFSNGAAGYKFMKDPNDVSRIASLASKRAQLTGQSVPAQYDTVTVHKGIHTGWASGSRNADVAINEKEGLIKSYCSKLQDDTTARINYEDVSREEIRLTTTGSELRTSIDRNWVDIRGDAETSDDAQFKIKQQAGSTFGFKDSADDLISKTINEFLDQQSRIAQYNETNKNGGKKITLSGSATGHLFHQLSRYFEMDTIYFGSSPVELGKQITSNLITVSDTIKPGSWAAIGFDAECKTTSPTQLISNGNVKNRLHSTVTALEESEQPQGNFIPSINPESAPRIHSRHLDVESGDETLESMLDDSSVYIKSVGTPTLINEATKTKQSSQMPPCSLYAKDIEYQTPESYQDEAVSQEIKFPIIEGYTLNEGNKRRLLSNNSLVVSLDDFHSISSVGIEKSTIEGICTKNKSDIPFSCSSPPVTLEAKLR